MDLTVRSMLDLEALDTLSVVAGQRGLDKKVADITFLDAPDAIKWIRGGEFIITTLYLYRDIEEQIKLIDHLAQKNVSALGIKLHRYVHSLTDEVIELANNLSLPLISIPNEKAWVDLINPVMAELLNRQLVILEKSNSIRRLFTEEVLEGRKLQSIAKLLSELTHNPITIIELINNGVVSWPYYFEHHLEQESLTYLQKSKDNKPEKVESVINQIDGMVNPIEVAKQVEGYIIVWKTKELRDLDLVAVEQATTVAALYIQQLKAVNEINQRFKDDFINHLLQGEYSSSYAGEKANEMGWVIGESSFVIVARIGADCGNNEWGRSYEIFNYYRNILSGYEQPNLLMGMDGNDTIVFIIPVQKDPQSLEETVELICSTRQKLLSKDSTLKLGLGMSSQGDSIEAIPRLYEEACRACKVSIALGKFCRYEELGAYSLLIELLEYNETESFINQLILPVLEHDNANNTALFYTLETFINNNCNYRETAKKLYVHHNTVRYRLETIESLIGIDLKKPETMLNLMLGIKLFNLTK